MSGGPPGRLGPSPAGDEERAAPPPETSSPTDDRTEPPTCEVCGGTMYERHCKIVCPRCGYVRDCSDP